jgi:hypothetical protein
MRYILQVIKERILFFLYKILCSKEEDNITNPFFIFSPGRSGSTFLRKEMISYTNANIPPESGDCIPQAMMTYVTLYLKSWEQKVNGIIKVFTESKDFKYWNIDLGKVESKLINNGSGTLRIIIKSIYDEFADKYHFNKNFWGDKTPYLTERINWIKMLFPHSKIIFIDRNTEEIIYSRMKNLHESYEQASNRIINARKSIEKHSKKGEFIFMLTLNKFINQKDEYLNSMVEFLGGNILEKKITGFYMGDDILDHHNKLHKNLNF